MVKQVKVVAIKDGESSEFAFPESTKLEDALNDVGEAMGFSSVSVFDKHGKELFSADEQTTLGVLGEIEIVKKMQGAKLLMMRFRRLIYSFVNRAR